MIIGNPPWGAYLSESERSYLRSVFWHNRGGEQNIKIIREKLEFLGETGMQNTKKTTLLPYLSTLFHNAIIVAKLDKYA